VTKTDIQSAFCIIPVHPDDCPGRLKFSKKALPFGLISAPYLFNKLSDALECLVKNHLTISYIIHILDDFKPTPVSYYATAICPVIILFVKLNILFAPKTFCPTQVLEFT